MRKLKIAIIGVKGLPAIGGAARANEALVKILSNDYDITVYEISTHKSKVNTNLSYKSILFKGSPSKRFNTFAYYLKSCFHALLKGDYDIVHTNHIYSGFIVPFLRIKFKVINTIRGIIPSDDNKWNIIDKFMFRIFEKTSLVFSNISVSVSKPQIKYLDSLTSKKVLFIPNGADIIESLLQERIVSKKDTLVFSAARIIKLKGCHTFLEALQKIKYDKKIKIIGSLDHVEKYKQEILKLSRGLDVEFCDLISEKRKLFSELLTANYFVFPSTKEGLSNMLLEVASLNIPIICSDIEENKAVFSDEEVLYFRTDDSDDLAKKIEFALNNPTVMQNLSQKALEKLKSTYQWVSIASEYSKLYESLNSSKTRF